jgi:hypothetical protein
MARTLDISANSASDALKQAASHGKNPRITNHSDQSAVGQSDIYIVEVD